MTSTQSQSALRWATRLFRSVALWPLIAILILFVCAVTSQAYAAPFAYVANGGVGTVLVIDVAINTIVATISLPAGFSPTRVVVTPDGTRVYVTNVSTVSVIDTAMNSVLVPAITVGFGASGLAVAPNGRFVYVAVQFEDTVSVIDTASNAVVATVNVGRQPTSIGVTPDGSRLYVAHSVDGTVWVIDTATEVVRLSISDATGVLLDETLAGGSFKQIARDDAIFHSSRNGSGIQMLRVTAEPEGGVYRFQVLADTSAVPDSNEPRMTLSLQIGNDTGSAVLTCRRRGAWDCR